MLIVLLSFVFDVSDDVDPVVRGALLVGYRSSGVGDGVPSGEGGNDAGVGDGEGNDDGVGDGEDNGDGVGDGEARVGGGVGDGVADGALQH